MNFILSSYEVNNESLCSSNKFNVKLWIYGFIWTSYEKASRSIVQMSCQSVAPPVSAMHDSIQPLAEGSVPPTGLWGLGDLYVKSSDNPAVSYCQSEWALHLLTSVILSFGQIHEMQYNITHRDISGTIYDDQLFIVSFNLISLWCFVLCTFFVLNVGKMYNVSHIN